MTDTPLNKHGGDEQQCTEGGARPLQRAATAADGLPEQVLRLTQEKDELMDYNRRVTDELHRYQLESPPPPDRPHGDMLVLPWATNMHMLSPLLVAYEERLAKLEPVVERSSSVEKQAQSLAKQNETLQAELREKTEQLRSAESAHDRGGGRHRHEDVEELYRLSMEENDALAQHNRLLKSQLQKAQSSLRCAQSSSHELHMQALAEGYHDFHLEEEHVELLAREHALAEEQVDSITRELSEEAYATRKLQTQLDGAQLEMQHCQSVAAARHATLIQAEQPSSGDRKQVLELEGEHRQQLMAFELKMAEVSEHMAVERKREDSRLQEFRELAQADLMKEESQLKNLMREKDIAKSVDHNELWEEAECFERQFAWKAAALEWQCSVHIAERDRCHNELQEARQQLEWHADAAHTRVRELKSQLIAALEEAGVLATQEDICHVRCQNMELGLMQAREEAHEAGAALARLRAELQDECCQAGAALASERRHARTERAGLERHLHLITRHFRLSGGSGRG